MENKLRSSGFIFSGIFMVGFLVNFVGITIRGEGVVRALIHPYQLLLVAFSLIFIASALVAGLRWLQPAVFLAAAPLSIVPEPKSIFGLSFYIMGVLLLERAGIFQKRRGQTVVLLALYLTAMEVVGVFYRKRPIFEAIAPTFFILSFGLFLWFLYKDKLVIIIKEPKGRVSLAERGLSPAERSYVLALIEGKSPKEIAGDFEVTDSTVRNTLVRAYKKLEVEDVATLMVLAATYEIVA
jgi:DNA-binding CsgD family transcriptional regulator